MVSTQTEPSGDNVPILKTTALDSVQKSDKIRNEAKIKFSPFFEQAIILIIFENIQKMVRMVEIVGANSILKVDLEKSNVKKNGALLIESILKKIIGGFQKVFRLFSGDGV
jgi:hypothetical protein